MSAYPPPPPPSSSSSSSSVPPPAGPGYPSAGYPPPAYDPRAWKAQAKMQERMLRTQVRMQRDAARAQARAARRYSVVGPLFLLLIGIAFLLLETGRVSWGRATDWYGHWWPLLLIGAGLLMLAEWALNGRRGALLGGGMVTLLIFLGSLGWTAGVMHAHTNWNVNSFEGWTPFLGDLHEEDGPAVSSAVAPDGTLLIHNPRGDVSVTGASQDGQVHVTVRKEIRSTSDSSLNSDRSTLQPSLSGTPAALELSVGYADGSHADLQVTVPRGVTVSVNAEHGAINVAELHAPVSISAGRGEVSLSGVTGLVTAHLHDRNGSFSAHSVSGGLSIDGRGGDLNLSDIAGPVDMKGEFFGTTHVERVNGSVSFQTFRTLFTAARLDGQLEISSGSRDAPLQGEAILGPLVLHTKDRVVTLDRVQGNVDINNSNGSVSLNTAGPLGAISVQDRNGSVDVGVPPSSAFTVSAQTHDGHISNEFGLSPVDNDDRPSLFGTVGHGGPSLSLVTTDGDVTVHKSSALPLPAAVATTPVLTDTDATLPGTAAPKPAAPAKKKPKTKHP